MPYRRLYLLFVLLTLATLAQLTPVYYYATEPLSPWMRAVILLVFLQLAYWLWMLLIPDSSSLRIAMFLNACGAVFYAFTLALSILTPEDAVDLLQINALRDEAQTWTAAMLLVSGMMTLSCGQFGFRWRKEADRLLPQSPPNTNH